MAQRLAVAAALALLCSGLTACGGGSDRSATAARNFAAGGANVVAVTVGPGPADPSDLTFNIPYVNVTVCQSGQCATIPDVLVDTGSYGLRLMASAVTNAGLSPSAMADPANPANTVAECLPFADGYSWGAVSRLSVTIGGESTRTAIPVQIIDDSQPALTAPTGAGCANGVALNSVDAFDANGVLGIGVFDEDCGPTCAEGPASGSYYWSCPAGAQPTACSQALMPLADQVANPVPGFAVDNNGIILQLPAVPDGGAPTASGYLVFGIGTAANNALRSDATVLTTNTLGEFLTRMSGLNLPDSFIDSGSNGLFFPNPANQLPLCSQTADFYCPSATTSLSAELQGQNGVVGQVTFQVADLSSISLENFAIDDDGGPAESISKYGTSYFDWGLPFFYGRTVYFAIEGMTAGNHTGPFYAYQ